MFGIHFFRNVRSDYEGKMDIVQTFYENIASHEVLNVNKFECEHRATTKVELTDLFT